MFVLNSSGSGPYDLLINDELTVGANSVTSVTSSYEFNQNYFTVSCTFSFIPTQADPIVAFSALYNIAPFADQDQISGCATVSLVTASTGSDGNVKISSSASSSSVVFSFNTPGFDSEQVYECQAVFSYFTAPLSALSFISTWTTPDTITLPLSPTGTYDFLINWGDGNIDHITSYDQAEITHTYSTGGDYTLVITGVCEGWAFRDFPDSKDKITEIVQWGNFKMGDATLDGGYFYQCTNLTISTLDIPDLTGVFSFKEAFTQTAITNIPLLDQWITSDITNMSACFEGCASFIGDGMEAWDTRNVTDFSYMLHDCALFNATIGLWVTQSATSMSNMLRGCLAFDQNLNAWDTSLVEDFTRILQNCSSFTGNVFSWITDSASSFAYSFSGCTLFNQDLSGFNVANVTDATSMLDNTSVSVSNYDALLISWAAQTVQNGTPFGASNLKYSVSAISAHNTLTGSPNDWVITDAGVDGAFVAIWDTEASGEAPGVTTITLPLVSTGTYDFYVDWGDGNTDHITAYDQAEVTHDYGVAGIYTTTIYGTIEGWCFRDVPDSAIKINELSSWGSLKMGNGGGYFYDTYYMAITATDVPDLTGMTSFNQAFFSCAMTSIPNLNMWDVSGINDMLECFKFCWQFDGVGLNSWNVTNVTTMSGMLNGCQAFNLLLDNWTTSSLTDASFMFYDCEALNQPINFDMSLVTTTESMLASCTVFNSSVDGMNFPVCINMSNMFHNSISFNQNLFSTGNFSTPNVQTFAGFLLNAQAFNQPMDDLDVSSCEDFSQMFRQSLFNQPLPSWNTQNATSFFETFRLTPFNQDVSTFDLSNGPDLSYMFYQSGFNQVPGFDTSACTFFDYMFAECSFNQDVSGLNMSSATSIYGMFEGNTAFNQDLSGWIVTSITQATDFLLGATLSNANYNALLIGWAAQTVQNGVIFNGGNSHYDGAGVAARAVLTGTYGWTITDGGTP